jgi:formamidopyrimidine-DNA glycosylase
MPELPEVQTIINNLKRVGVLNKTITNVHVYKDKLIKNTSINNFKKFFIDEKIIGIERIGKYIILKFSHFKVLTVHLRMEGKLFYEPLKSPYPTTHLRLEFIFNNRHALKYYDSRMFGTFHIYKNDDYLKAHHIKKVALDPLNEHFNASYLQKQIGKSNKTIKTALLDQTKVSGIGNIYADEILFIAKLHPLSKACYLNYENYQDIAKAAKQVLQLAIKHGGTTIVSYK